MMTRVLNVLLCALLAGGLSCSATPARDDAKPVENASAKGPQLIYPETRQEAIVETIHGVEVADPYRWLEDVESEEVQAWMNAQDAVTREWIGELPNRDALAKRFAELYYVDMISAPNRRGEHYFYSRRHADREKRVYYWRKGEEGDEQVLLDPNTMSEDGSISVGFVRPSWDGKTVAYSLKENNADEAVLYLMDVETGNVSDVDVIPGIKYGRPSWTPDGKGFYYVYLPKDESVGVADRPGLAEVRYHAVGTDPKNDPLVAERTGDPKIFLGVDLSRDGKYLFLYRWHGWNAADVYYRDLSKGDEDFKPLVVGKKALFSVEAHEDQFYIITNEDASRYKVMKVDASAPEKANWKTLIPEFKDGSVIENVQIIGGQIVVTLTRDVQSDMRIFDYDGKLVRDIELPGVGASFGMTGTPEDDTAYFSFQSPTTPLRIFKTSIATGTTDLWAKVDVPVDPEPYVVEQVFYPSKDGTEIPMFIVRRKDMPKDGSTPFVLNGYGGFSVTMHPYFRSSIYPWLEAGGGFAIASLRGGAEYGEEWHEAGMLEKKQNVYDDFIAGAEYLVKEGYTSPKKLAVRGGSNGGLLVGAVMTQRPDLFGAIVCAVPLLDMVRYHLFGSGKTWIAEYGDPEKPEDFAWLYAYSPYHHVEPGTAYPALLMLAADSDDRVDPMHARKFAAAVQNATSSGEPTLLRVERNAGHGGADLIKQQVEADADTYAFLMKVLMKDAPETSE